MPPPGTCNQMPVRFALTASKLRAQSTNGTTFVTFADGNVASFALNWAWLLQQLGLRSLVGISGHLDRDVEARFHEVDADVFCADGPLMAANGQAGRWSELLPVLQLARTIPISVLLSDADIAWMRDPLPYFAAVRASHPRVDLLMMTDRAFNNYVSTPLKVQPNPAPLSRWAGRRLWGSAETATRAKRVERGGGGSGGDLGFELELEPGYDSAISYNIGVIWFCAHALEGLEGMVERFMISVGGEGGSVLDQNGKLRKKKVRANQLASWDQDPINKEVLQKGLRHDPEDHRLVRVDRGRLAMGVLPMLQFTTSFTYYMHRKRREMIGAAPPYCLHAIFAHGKDIDRKRGIFREERLWRDPPAYYDSGRRFLAADTFLSKSQLAVGGFDMISAQVFQVHQAMRLAALTNRTLVLPRLKCGERPMAYPCYAWYHRAFAYFGVNPDKVPMPEVCPMYYWLELAKLAGLAPKLPTREPSFLENPRVPAAVTSSVANVRFTRPDGSGVSNGDVVNVEVGGPGRKDLEGRNGPILVPGASDLSDLRRLLRGTEMARVLRVRNLHYLQLPVALGSAEAKTEVSTTWPNRRDLNEVTRGFWCTACPITRRGAVVHELNKSVVHELEGFCKSEARGKLGRGPMRSCCSAGGACHMCQPWETKITKNESELSWALQLWLPTFAKLEMLHSQEKPCAHPFCTGTDRKRFP